MGSTERAPTPPTDDAERSIGGGGGGGGGGDSPTDVARRPASEREYRAVKAFARLGFQTVVGQ